MDFKNKSKEELLDLYNAAVDAYEAGESIMSDEEYDCLVGYLNCENEAKIGSVSKSSKYTVQHSIIMGSLDKVHTEEDEVTHARNYEEVVQAINRHVMKSPGIQYIECLPKYDGCSFSLEVQCQPKGSGTVLSCATRGDGMFGKDILCQFMNSSFEKDYTELDNAANNLLSGKYDTLMIRGEAITEFSTYEKWSDKFSNIRVFISGNLNADYDADDLTYRAMCDDIRYLCYDYRLVNSQTGEYVELSYNNTVDPTYNIIRPYVKGLGYSMPKWSVIVPVSADNPLTVEKFKEIYEFYSDFRKSCPYPMDGIVIKPNCSARIHNTDRERPLDMIAVKFITEKMESEIVDIEWSVGRNEECYPVAILKPVYQDGKVITKASLHGYSYVKKNNVGIGSKVIIVMNGDIIPGVYSVESEGELKMPEFDTYVKTIGDNNIEHLMKVFTEEEKAKHSFVNSAKALQVEGIKEQTAEKMFDKIYEFSKKRYENLMELMTEESYSLVRSALGDSKSTQNIIASLEKYRQNITLADVVRGCGFPGVGKRLSKVVESYILDDGSVTDKDINFSVLSWLQEEWHPAWKKIYAYAETVGLNIERMKEEIKNMKNQLNENGGSVGSEEQIKVILTGDPSKCCDYKTKKEWLAAHPRYVETTKWSECQILFTNDIESKTGKMAKAVKNGVEIRLYED